MDNNNNFIVFFIQEKEITENQAEARQKYLQFMQECERLKAALNKSNDDLAQSRQLLDEEKKRRCAIEDVKNQLVILIFFTR